MPKQIGPELAPEPTIDGRKKAQSQSAGSREWSNQL